MIQIRIWDFTRGKWRDQEARTEQKKASPSDQATNIEIELVQRIFSTVTQEFLTAERQGKEHERIKGTRMQSKIITEFELANWLRISKSTLHKLRQANEIPYRLLGTCIRYSVTEIEAWLNDKSVNKSAKKPGTELETQTDNSDFTQPDNKEKIS